MLADNDEVDARSPYSDRRSDAGSEAFTTIFVDARQESATTRVELKICSVAELDHSRRVSTGYLWVP